MGDRHLGLLELGGEDKFKSGRQIGQLESQRFSSYFNWRHLVGD